MHSMTMMLSSALLLAPSQPAVGHTVSSIHQLNPTTSEGNTLDIQQQLLLRAVKTFSPNTELDKMNHRSQLKLNNYKPSSNVPKWQRNKRWRYRDVGKPTYQKLPTYEDVSNSTYQKLSTYEDVGNLLHSRSDVSTSQKDYAFPLLSYKNPSPSPPTSSTVLRVQRYPISLNAPPTDNYQTHSTHPRAQLTHFQTHPQIHPHTQSTHTHPAHTAVPPIQRFIPPPTPAAVQLQRGGKYILSSKLISSSLSSSPSLSASTVSSLVQSLSLSSETISPSPLTSSSFPPLLSHHNPGQYNESLNDYQPYQQYKQQQQQKQQNHLYLHHKNNSNNKNNLHHEQQQQQHIALTLPLYLRVWATVCLCLVLVVGVLGNLLVPLLVWLNRDLRHSTNLFLLNLAAADLLVLLVCLPTAMVELYVQQGIWVLGYAMCFVVAVVEVVVSRASVMTLVVISVERYMAICRPLSTSPLCTTPRAGLLCVALWLLAVVSAVPTLQTTQYTSSSHPDGGEMHAVCVTGLQIPWAPFYHLAAALVFVLLPCLLLLGLYAIIASRLLLQKPHAPRRYLALQQWKAKKQVALMLGAVVFVFFACLLPFQIFTLWIIFSTDQAYKSLSTEVYYNILYGCRLCLYINSAANPIIYNAMSSKFRHALWRLLGRPAPAHQKRPLRRQSTLTTSFSSTSFVSLRRRASQVISRTLSRKLDTNSGSPDTTADKPSDQGKTRISTTADVNKHGQGCLGRRLRQADVDNQNYGIDTTAGGEVCIEGCVEGCEESRGEGCLLDRGDANSEEGVGISDLDERTNMHGHSLADDCCEHRRNIYLYTIVPISEVCTECHVENRSAEPNDCKLDKSRPSGDSPSGDSIEVEIPLLRTDGDIDCPSHALKDGDSAEPQVSLNDIHMSAEANDLSTDADSSRIPIPTSAVVKYPKKTTVDAPLPSSFGSISSMISAVDGAPCEAAGALIPAGTGGRRTTLRRSQGACKITQVHTSLTPTPAVKKVSFKEDTNDLDNDGEENAGNSENTVTVNNENTV